MGFSFTRRHGDVKPHQYRLYPILLRVTTWDARGLEQIVSGLGNTINGRPGSAHQAQTGCNSATGLRAGAQPDRSANTGTGRSVAARQASPARCAAALPGTRASFGRAPAPPAHAGRSLAAIDQQESIPSALPVAAAQALRPAACPSEPARTNEQGSDRLRSIRGVHRQEGHHEEDGRRGVMQARILLSVPQRYRRY